ncbi:MAG: exodeoxyribonuclease III [Thermoanaerobaculia bacterium]|jgi:exodeoxyribonuclease-3
MKVATWNVNGIRAREAQFVEFATTVAPDVICLQELKAAPEQIPASVKVEGYETYWHGRKGYSGVSLHLKKGAHAGEPLFAHPEFDMESRIVSGQVGDTLFVSVYVPNGGKDYAAKIDFFTKLCAWVREVHARGQNLVLCGDMNITRSDVDVHPKERKADVIGQRPEERELFATLLGDDLVDVGRQVDPSNEMLFTWWAPWRQMRQRNIGWRIDYILASKAIASRATSCIVMPAFGTSDHAPVIMEY